MKALVTLSLPLLFLTSCNTMIGMGRDVRQLGEGIEHSAHGRNFDGSEPTPSYDETVPAY